MQKEIREEIIIKENDFCFQIKAMAMVSQSLEALMFGSIMFECTLGQDGLIEVIMGSTPNQDGLIDVIMFQCTFGFVG